MLYNYKYITLTILIVKQKFKHSNLFQTFQIISFEWGLVLNLTSLGALTQEPFLYSLVKIDSEIGSENEVENVTKYIREDNQI